MDQLNSTCSRSSNAMHKYFFVESTKSVSRPLWGPQVYGSCWSAGQWWVQACVSDRVYVKCCLIQTHADVRPLTLQKKNQQRRSTVEETDDGQVVTSVKQHKASEMSISTGDTSLRLFFNQQIM